MVALPELLATAEEYGVAADVVYLHYASYVGGLASGAEQLEALAVFAPSPSRAPAFWRRFRRWQMARALTVPFYTLDPDQKVVLPIITAEAAATDAINVPRLASRS